MKQLEQRREALRVHSSVLRRRIGVDGSHIAQSLTPAERAVRKAQRIVRSPLVIAGAVLLAMWLGPRRLTRVATRAVMGVAIVRRALSMARALR